MAMRSSNSVGPMSRSASFMPGLSNWNTPVESPRASIVYVFWSSSGSWSISMQTPRVFSMILSAASMTSRLRRPRKSILSRPSLETSFMSNCVTSSASPFCCSGRYSVSGLSLITTAAAWMESLRMRPSRLMARSTTSLTSSSAS